MIDNFLHIISWGKTLTRVKMASQCSRAAPPLDLSETHAFDESRPRLTCKKGVYKYYYGGTYLYGPPIKKILNLALQKYNRVNDVLASTADQGHRYRLFVNRTRNRLDAIREIITMQKKKFTQSKFEFEPFANAVPCVLHMDHLKSAWAVDIFVLIFFGVLKNDRFNGHPRLKLKLKFLHVAAPPAHNDALAETTSKLANAIIG